MAFQDITNNIRLPANVVHANAVGAKQAERATREVELLESYVKEGTANTTEAAYRAKRDVQIETIKERLGVGEIDKESYESSVKRIHDKYNRRVVGSIGSTKTPRIETDIPATSTTDDVIRSAAKQGDEVIDTASRLKGKGGYLVAAALVGATIWGITAASSKSKERKRRTNHGVDISNQASQVHRFL